MIKEGDLPFTRIVALRNGLPCYLAISLKRVS
jgi:hypothetical protein